MPVASFDAHLLELFRRGSVDSIEVNFKSTINKSGRSVAIRLRQRMYQLRLTMEREQHEMYPVAARVTIRIIDTEAGATMIVGPSDDQFLEAIKEAGVDLDQEAPSLGPDFTIPSIDDL